MTDSSTVDSAYSTAVESRPDAESPTTSLRWWPALAIMLGMVALKFSANFFEAPPLPVLIASFMGPGILALGLPVWWLAASRAAWRERLIGICGLLVIALVSILAAHVSMQGMSTMLYQIPVGMIAFALPLVLLASNSGIRLPVALLSAVAGFGVWDTLQMHGTTGKFQPEFASRWQVSEEDRYLEELEKRSNQTNENELVGDDTTILRSESPWPDFRGSDRSGVVHDLTLQEDWTANQPTLVWKSRIGPGWSSFTVGKNFLFTQEQRGEEEAVVCLDSETGSEVWAYVYPGRFWEAIGGAGPRATPTLGDNRLYALGANGRLACINPVNGQEIWHRELKEITERDPPQWGWSASPLLVGDLVVVHAGGADGKGLLAFNQQDGQQVWQAESGDHSYSSPQLSTIQGVEGILMACNQGLRFHSVADGTILWFHEWQAPNYRVTQPLVLGNSILLGTSLGTGTQKIDIDKVDDAWSLSTDWTSRAMKPDYNDFVAFENNLYGFDGNIFACMDLDKGKKIWKRGRYGNGQVVLLDASGQLLIVSEKGELVLLKASPERLIELAKFPAIEGKTWNHPVVTGTRVYLRNGQEAACYELPVLKDED